MIIEVTGTMVVQERAREWCKLPYPGHPKGCPNYGDPEHRHCPPHVKRVAEFIDLSRPHWFIVASFDLAAHARAMAEKHPQWSDRQCRCCLYWQGTVRKNLGVETMAFIMGKPGTVSTLIPEAMGVNVFRTCHRHGLMLRRNPRDTVYKVALVGYGSAADNQQLRHGGSEDSAQMALPLHHA